MLGLRNLKGALHLLLLTVFITYTCLYTLSFLNQFQPQLIPSPQPVALVVDRRVQGLPKTSWRNQSFEDQDDENFDIKDSINKTSVHLEQTQLKERKDYEDDRFPDNDTKDEETSEEENTDRPKQWKDVWPIILEPSDAASLHEIDFSKYSLKDQKILKARLSVMDERAKLVGEVCRKQPPGIHQPSGANHLVWDTQHDPNIVWCPNYKVASTSMMMSFMRLTKKRQGLKSKKFVKQGEVRRVFWTPSSDRKKAEIFKKSIRVIIVRHPFTRILSAYRDKMTKENPGPAKFDFPSIQKKIIAKYRKESSAVDSPFPTFPEFVQYVIDETRSLTTSEEWRDNVRCWVSYWAHCNVCTTDYNVIIKLETMAEDKEFLVTLANLKQLKKASSNEWRHLKTATSQDLAPKYYSHLTRDQILQLYESYRLDFELFGYDIEEYLALV